MAEQSKIEWTDATFNPWIGCTKVGPGCDHCYAETLMDHRHHRVKWGAGQTRSRTSAANWKLPLRWDRVDFVECPSCGWRGEEGNCHAGDPGPACPKCGNDEMRQARRRVFCASLADVFDNEVDPAWRADLFALIVNTPNLDWLILTKRIGNARQMIHEACRGLSHEWPLPNVWLGATVVNQEEADRDIPKLLMAPARIRFLSIEPMLGQIDLRSMDYKSGALLPDAMRVNDGRCILNALEGRITWPGSHYISPTIKQEIRIDGGTMFESRGEYRHIDWVIAGGESGPGARPERLDWYQVLRDHCAAARVPFLFKQHGEWFACGTDPATVQRAAQYMGGTVRTHVWPDGHAAVWLGKKRSGRLLDGIEHNGYPRSQA